MNSQNDSISTDMYKIEMYQRADGDIGLSQFK